MCRYLHKSVVLRQCTKRCLCRAADIWGNRKSGSLEGATEYLQKMADPKLLTPPPPLWRSCCTAWALRAHVACTPT